MQSSSLNGGKTDDRHVFPGDGGALGGNPLHQTISFQAWALALPRWILRTRTSLAFNLFKSFTAEWRSSSSSTATFPLPAPYPGCFAGGGPHLSKKRLAQLAQQRALHVAVVILNDKMYLGRYASLDELGRRPNAWQRKRLGQLRSFYVACGGYQERFPLAPGRSGPELGASLYQLEKFLEEEAQFASCYMDFKPFMFKDDPDLFPRDDFPQLVPYKSFFYFSNRRRSFFQTVCCGFLFKSRAFSSMAAPSKVLIFHLLQLSLKRRIYDWQGSGMLGACSASTLRLAVQGAFQRCSMPTSRKSSTDR